jgi:hypothetical protein
MRKDPLYLAYRMNDSLVLKKRNCTIKGTHKNYPQNG